MKQLYNEKVKISKKFKFVNDFIREKKIIEKLRKFNFQ